MTTVAPEQTGFELDRFQWSGDDRLEVEGRWFGVRGRRFVRPVLTVQAGGRRRRLLALLEHKPWTPDEGEAWVAAFPWAGPYEDVSAAELEVGALTVDLPPPGRGERFARRHEAVSTPPAATVVQAPQPAPAPPEPAGEPVLHVAGESRQHLERDLASARAELGRLRARHDEELREARAQAREARERAEALETRAGESAERAEQLADEAKRLREELRKVRESQGQELTRMGASEAEARAELARERERAGEVEGEAERLRAAAAEADRVASEREGAHGELARLREAHEEALAEIAKLRQAARRSVAEAERLRAASRRPGSRLADPQGTAPEGEEPAEPRSRPPAPSKPGPAVRLIPREKPAPPEAEAPDAEPEPEPEIPTAAEAPATEAAPPATRPQVSLPSQAPRIRPEPGTGAARLRGEDALVPLEQRGTLAVWGPRLVAVVLVVLLLVALALIVRGVA